MTMTCLTASPSLAVVPVLVGPLQVLIALLPALLAAIGSLLFALCKPSTFKLLLKFLWRQKLLSVGLIAVVVCCVTGFPLSLLRGDGQSISGNATGNVSGEWPSFRGGITRSGCEPTSKEPTSAAAVWTAEREVTVMSSPAAFGDRIVVTTVFGAGAFNPVGNGAVVCLDANSGETVWKFAPDDFRGTFASPVVGEGRIIVGEGLHVTSDARITCLDLSGRLQWQFTTASHVEATACIADGRVFVGAGDDGFYALALEPNADGSARVLWHLDGKQFPDCESSAAVFDGVVYFGLGEGGQALCAVDASTGKERWRIATSYPVFAPPTIADGKLFVGMGLGNFVQSADELRTARLDELRESGASASQIEAARIALAPAGELWCVDLASQRIEWRHKLPDTVLDAAAWRDGRLFVATRNGVVWCLSDDGRELSHWDAHEPVLSSPAVGEQGVYISTKSGRLIALKRESLEPLWEMSLGSVEQNNVSSPIVAHGHVYVGLEGGGVRCVGSVEPPRPSNWTQWELGGSPEGREPLPESVRVAWRVSTKEKSSDPKSFIQGPLFRFGETIYVPLVSKIAFSRLPLRFDTGGIDEAARRFKDEHTADGAVMSRTVTADIELDQIDGQLAAFDLQTGRELWSRKHDEPPVGTVIDRVHFLLTTRTGVSRHRMTDGEVEWQRPLSKICSPTVISQGRAALVTLGEVVVLSIETGEVLVRKPCSQVGVPPLLDGQRVVYEDAHRLKSLDLQTFEVKYWLDEWLPGSLPRPLVAPIIGNGNGVWVVATRDEIWGVVPE